MSITNIVVRPQQSHPLQMIVCLLVSNKEETCQQIGHVARGGVAEGEHYGMQSPRGRAGGSERLWLRRGFRRRCQLRGASHSPELALLCLPLPWPAHSGAAEAAEHQAHHRIAGGLCAVCLLFLPTTCRSFSLSLSLSRLPSFAEPIPLPSLPDLPCFRLLLLARVSSNGAVHPSVLPSSPVYSSMRGCE